MTCLQEALQHSTERVQRLQKQVADVSSQLAASESEAAHLKVSVCIVMCVQSPWHDTDRRVC